MSEIKVKDNDVIDEEQFSTGTEEEVELKEETFPTELEEKVEVEKENLQKLVSSERLKMEQSFRAAFEDTLKKCMANFEEVENRWSTKIQEAEKRLETLEMRGIKSETESTGVITRLNRTEEVIQSDRIMMFGRMDSAEERMKCKG